ncbi:plastid division protein CDP1, chloroplastic [Silene latifolia]|uniref:plastid division protein CDP1, chloroplastic n=1 Tax=Silene latifolia TaxID=37657 RepID=UPI003D76F075
MKLNQSTSEVVVVSATFSLLHFRRAYNSTKPQHPNSLIKIPNFSYHHHHHLMAATSSSTSSIPSILLPEISSASHYCSFRRIPICSAFQRRDAAVSAAVGRDLRRRWRAHAATTSLRLLDAHVNGHTTSSVAGVEIPVSCYQIIGVPDRAEKDHIVKSVMDLKNAEVEDGYTTEAVTSRRDLLMDVRDKLLFEPEYAGNIKEKIPPKSTLRIPWVWLPGALCLLQEVGEEKLVLEVGRAALQYPDAKPHVHDLLLSMALAECAIAKTHFEKNKVSQGFEALARAQCLLRSKSSLEKMNLLFEIEESLEGLAPACTLELLAMPQTPDNVERRRGAIAALRELLSQGLDVEASCQVQDWPSFFSQALGKLMAVEIVDLIPWDSLASTRKNKKSLDSQNQRVVIDFDCFYTALMAHIAFGYSSRQTDLISKAKLISECLMVSDGADLKLEEAFCLFLLGQGSEADALERLREAELKKSSGSRNSIFGKQDKDVATANCSLEKWLKDTVLCLFSDTRDCSASVSVGKFFGREKKVIGNKQSKLVSNTNPNVNHRAVISSDLVVSDDRLASLVSSQHLGAAVKQLTPTNLRSSMQEAKTSNTTDTSAPSPQLKRDLGGYHNKAGLSWMAQGHVVGRITFVAVLGCIVFATTKMLGRPTGRLHQPGLGNRNIDGTMCSSLDNFHVSKAMPTRDKLPAGLKQFLSTLKISPMNHLDTVNRQTSYVTTTLSSPSPGVYNGVMPLEEAEALVRQWQVIKAEALGPDHQSDLLFDILDEDMLVEWQALADAAKGRSCFWRFVLLQLSVLRAGILSNSTGPEMAEVEVLLEEAAELVDGNDQKNPNYYSTYRITYLLKRQDDGSWRFCKADIDTSS